jgi:type II secretory pathway predicted ATPase ExeA
MYKEFFGLQENPFSVNTDPRYLYLTRSTQEALSYLTYGIEARKGFILLSGEVGTGKTTLLHKLLDVLHQQNVASAFVFNPRLSASQLFDYMMADFGIPCKSRTKSQALFQLHQWLLNRYAAGEKTVLVVDEAQNLPRQALEEIRLLTNLETSTEKLLQIVLAGQPELEQKLNRRELRQLRQRIALRAKTMPLTAEETHGYIHERLRIAGAGEGEILTPPAIDTIYKHARGIPRVTNLIAEHVLLRAFVEQRKPVTEEIIESVTRDFSLDEGEPLAQPAPRSSSRRSRQSERPRVRRPAAHDDGSTEQPVQAEPSLGVTQTTTPLFVYGYRKEGAPFYEQVATVATNPRGGLIAMQTPVEPGQKLLITNKETERSQECVVECVGAQLARGVDVAVSFSAPAPEFWGPKEIGPGENDKPAAPAEENAEAACA